MRHTPPSERPQLSRPPRTSDTCWHSFRAEYNPLTTHAPSLADPRTCQEHLGGRDPGGGPGPRECVRRNRRSSRH